MSTQVTVSKEIAFPFITPREFHTWKMRMNALLAAKRLLYTIKEMPKQPVLDQARIQALRRQRKEEEADGMVKAHDELVTKWTDDNAAAYHYLLQACSQDYEAMTVVVENRDATAGGL